MLKHVSINKLKQHLHQSIDEMKQETVREMYFNSSSIDDIIPADVIQHILSFQSLDLKNVKCVNKQWNKLSMQNERNYHIKLQQRMNEGLPIYHMINQIAKGLQNYYRHKVNL